MQEAFDAAVADDPHSVYAAFDPAWCLLSPAAQLVGSKGVAGADGGPGPTS